MSFPFADVLEMDSILDYSDYKMQLLGDDRCDNPGCSYCYSDSSQYDNLYDQFWFDQDYYRDLSQYPEVVLSYQDMLDAEEGDEFEVMFSKLKKSDENFLTTPHKISGQRVFLESQYDNFSMIDRRRDRKQRTHKNWTLRNHREG